MSRQIGSFRFVLCATPSYLERKGIPQIPSDLEQHDCLRYRFATTGKLMDWTMSADPLWSRLRLSPMLTFNNMEAVFTAAIEGWGIAYMPDFLVHSAVRKKVLQIVLDDYQVDRGQFWALWPSNRHLSPKIRVFVDFISTRLFA